MELQITLKRHHLGEHFTGGSMYVNGEKVCDTLEPPISTDIHPAILPGVYQIQMFPSAKFRAMRPILIGVKGRSGILIHEGNTVKNTQGCILVGNSVGLGRLINSKSHVAGLVKWIKSILKRDGVVTIDIQNCD